MRAPGMAAVKMPVFIATFACKPLFGCKSMTWATACIGVLSFFAWLHGRRESRHGRARRLLRADVHDPPGRSNARAR